MMMEYGGKFNLEYHLQRDKTLKFSFYNTQQLLTTILKAVKYLHNMNISHRNIIPSNILLTEGARNNQKTKNLKLEGEAWPIKLIGLQNMIQTGKESVFKVCGSGGNHRPAELICRKMYDPKKVDIWQVGIILFRIFTGEYPFGSNFYITFRPQAVFK